MKQGLAALTIFAVLAATTPALAEERPPPPSKGTGYLITGAVLTGVGVVTVIGTPSICDTGTGAATTGKSTTGCKNVGYIFGASFAAVGIPLIIIGSVKRSHYNTWLAEHPVVSGLSVTGLTGGAALGWTTTF